MSKVKINKPWATISWCVEDIQERRPDWDEKRCEEFLENFEEEIQLAMIEAGSDTILRMIPFLDLE